MSDEQTNVRLSFAGVQLTLLGLVFIALTGALPGLSTDAFAGAGVLCALAGTAVVASGLSG
jgi:hypothetical protein